MNGEKVWEFPFIRIRFIKHRWNKRRRHCCLPLMPLCWVIVRFYLMDSNIARGEAQNSGQKTLPERPGFF